MYLIGTHRAWHQLFAYGVTVPVLYLTLTPRVLRRLSDKRFMFAGTRDSPTGCACPSQGHRPRSPVPISRKLASLISKCLSSTASRKSGQPLV